MDDVALPGNLTYTGTYVREIGTIEIKHDPRPRTNILNFEVTTLSLLFFIFHFSIIVTDAIKSIIDTNDDGIASNWEYFIAMDPNNMDGNDYVWDHFNWDHCA